MVMRKTAGRASTEKEPAQTRGKEQSYMVVGAIRRNERERERDFKL